MRANGLITELTERESIYGKMDASIMVNGKIMIWKVMVSITGVTGDVMKDNITMIRNVDMGFTIGQTVDATRAGGSKVNNMG